VVEDVLRPPVPDTYEATKEKAIQSIKSRQVVENIFGPRRNPQSSRGDQRGWFQGPNQNQQNRNNRGSQNANWRQNANPQPRYNSTTAPPSYANVPVPMDLDHSQASSRGGRPMRGRVAQGRNPQNPLRTATNNTVCFQCRQMGHFARDCPQHQAQSQSRVTDWTEQIHAPNKFPIDDTSTNAPPKDRVSAAKVYFMALTEEERSQVSSDLGNSSDFPST